MAEQLAYVIITPYSLHKSRTGGILSRLLSRTGLDFAGARMFSPSEELVKKYSEAIISANDPQDRRVQDLIYNYILQNLSPDPKTGRRRRVISSLRSWPLLPLTRRKQNSGFGPVIQIKTAASLKTPSLISQEKNLSE